MIGFHFGAKDHDELKSLLKKSLLMLLICGVAMVAAAEALARPLALLFVGYDAELMRLTESGFRIFGLSFFFMGFAIFGSGFFTALNDGMTSAIISFLRTLVFELGAILVLPLLFGINGLWFSVVVAELMATVLSFLFMAAKHKRYGY